jgi:hypothetical protein
MTSPLRLLTKEDKMYRRIWLLKPTVNGFSTFMLVEGTEQEMWAYAQSELGTIPAYTGASEDEVKALKKMGAKIYIAPKLEEALQ